VTALIKIFMLVCNSHSQFHINIKLSKFETTDMPVKTDNRPFKNIREEVINQLVMNYGYEEITLEAFESHLDTAMATENRGNLIELVADLD